MSVWYIKDNGTVGWSGVTQWQASHAYSAGTFIRQSGTPAVGQERTFVCIIAGTSNSSAPSWQTDRGSKTTDHTVTWQECTGIAGPNGDATNTMPWAASVARTLGDVIKNVSGGADTYFICTTAGTSTSGSEPTWNKTAGQTTTDGSAVWTSIGAISGFSTPFAYPHARLANALAAGWGVNGDTFYISNNHAETQATDNSISLIGTAALPINILCVDDSAAPPISTATTATISTTSGSIIWGHGNGYCYMYGISFSSAADVRFAPVIGYFDSCNFTLNNSTSSSKIILGADGGGGQSLKLEIRNANFVFGSSSQKITGSGNCHLELIGGSVAATGTVPSTAIGFGPALIRDVDLSAITGNLCIDVEDYVFTNCKLGSGVSIVASSATNQEPLLRLHNCDSGNKNYRFYTASYMGTSQQETTTVRTGGASDGTTPISWNVTTSATSNFSMPFKAEEISQWNDTTGSSKTASIEIAGANTLTNADIWMEIEYPGSSSAPLGSVANCRAASILTTPTNVTSSSTSWGGSPAVTQKLQVTFTPQMKGPIKARIYVAKPSITVYVDPLITIS